MVFLVVGVDEVFVSFSYSSTLIFNCSNFFPNCWVDLTKRPIKEAILTLSSSIKSDETPKAFNEVSSSEGMNLRGSTPPGQARSSRLRNQPFRGRALEVQVVRAPGGGHPDGNRVAAPRGVRPAQGSGAEAAGACREGERC